jgi:hypothetical protein
MTAPIYFEEATVPVRYSLPDPSFSLAVCC